MAIPAVNNLLLKRKTSPPKVPTLQQAANSSVGKTGSPMTAGGISLAGQAKKVINTGQPTGSIKGPGVIYHADTDGQEINPENATVEGRVNRMLSGDSTYLQRAKQGAVDYMNARGGQNSTMAATAGEAAAIGAARDIALPDAALYGEHALAEQRMGHDLAQNKQLSDLTREQIREQGGQQRGNIEAEYAGRERIQDKTASDDMTELRARIGADYFRDFTGAMRQIEALRLAEIAQVQQAQGLSANKKTKAIEAINNQFSEDSGSFQFIRKLYENQNEWNWTL